MTENQYIIELLELLCYNCGIDTEPIRTGFKYRYDLYYKNIYMNSFDNRFALKRFVDNFFGGDESELFIKKIVISQ
ncbi:MAG: hypothetical protein IJY83_01055 [Oscillospiraceae bacterium]|nr:hypothetical protein [Oscillospiraceae bacterium]